MKFGLTKETIEAIRMVFSQYPQIEKVIIYGSRAMGTYKNNSDIDLTLSGGPELNTHMLQHILLDMDELLLPYLMDISILSQITDHSLLEHIEKHGQVFYSRPEKSLE